MKRETGFAPINNTKLYFEIVGTGKPLLLLHSGITDHRMWAEQARELSKQFQVIMPDFRGYSQSDIPEEPFRHAQDMYDFILYRGLKRVNIAGCSLGGKTTMELAIAHPEVVEHLILIAPGLAGYEYRDEETLAKDVILEGLISGGKKEEAVDMMLDIWLVGLSRVRSAVNPAMRELVRKMITDNYDSVTDKFPETELEFSVISRLGEIKAPTLVMVGDRDLPDMQAISKLVYRKIKGAKRQIILNAAHLPNLEYSSLFNQSVIDFLATG
jgi:3-oxoadipate enol-lactonase